MDLEGVEHKENKIHNIFADKERLLECILCVIDHCCTTWNVSQDCLEFEQQQ